MIRNSKFQISYSPPAVAGGSSQWRAGKFLPAVLLVVLAAGVFAPASQPAQAITRDSSSIGFKMTVEHSVYRVVRGGTININFSLEDLSLPPLNLGTDTISPSGIPGLEGLIDGVYSATVGAGTTQICPNLPTPSGCSFIASSPPHTSLPFNGTLAINLVDLQVQGLFPVGDKDLWLFPVLSLAAKMDYPWSDSLATVRVTVYADQAAYDAAAISAGVCPATGATDACRAQFAASGNPVTINSSGTVDNVAGSWADIFGGGMISLINAILTPIVALLRWIVWAIATAIIIPLLEVTLSIDAANISSTIFFGWTIVRDIVNMLFILILIIIGFATILKVGESYNYRRLLVELIIMAVLVNFSLVIGRIIIQFADVIQFTFLPYNPDGTGEGISGVRQLFKTLMVDQPIVAIRGWAGTSLSTSGALAATMSILFQFIIELGVVITFAILAIYTLIRIIALWFLLILSPFAYALRVLPATHAQASQWWSNFLKYAFFTPIMAFFIRLTIEIHTTGLKLTEGKTFGTPTGVPAPTIQDYLASRGGLDAVPFSASLELFINYMVTLGFMMGGMIVAKKMSIMGADAITSVAQKGLKAPFAYPGRLAKAGAKALGGAAERGWAGAAFNRARQAQLAGQTSRAMFWKAAAMLSPTVRKKAWKTYSEKQEKKSVDRAAALLADALHRVMPTQWRRKSAEERAEEVAAGRTIISRLPFKGKETHEAVVAEKTYVNDLASHHRKAALTAQDVAEQFLTALRSGDKVEIAAAYQNIGLLRNEDDFAALPEVRHEPEFANGVDVRAGFLQYAQRKFSEAGFTPQESAYYIGSTQELAEGDSKLRRIGDTTVDPDNQKRLSSDLSWYDQHGGTAEFTASMNEAAEAFASTARDMRRNIQNMRNVLQTLAPGSREHQVQSERIQAAENVAQRFENHANGFQTSIQNGNLEASVRDALISFRINKESNRRIQRMVPVQVAGNIETALVRRQRADGTFAEMTDSGVQFMHSLATPVQGALKNRAFQAPAREMRTSGIGLDASGNMIVPESSTNAHDRETFGVMQATNPEAAAVHYTKARGGDTREITEASTRVRGGDFTGFIS